MTQQFSMDEGAIALHEVFMSFVRAGFDRCEALELVKIHLVESIRSGLKSNDGE